jgi:hypothetical protein
VPIGSDRGVEECSFLQSRSGTFHRNLQIIYGEEELANAWRGWDRAFALRSTLFAAGGFLGNTLRYDDITEVNEHATYFIIYHFFSSKMSLHVATPRRCERKAFLP